MLKLSPSAPSLQYTEVKILILCTPDLHLVSGALRELTKTEVRKKEQIASSKMATLWKGKNENSTQADS